MSSITIPENVTSISNVVFDQWTSSQTINVSGYTSAATATGYVRGWNGNATVKWKGQF